MDLCRTSSVGGPQGAAEDSCACDGQGEYTPAAVSGRVAGESSAAYGSGDDARAAPTSHLDTFDAAAHCEGRQSGIEFYRCAGAEYRPW